MDGCSLADSQKRDLMYRVYRHIGRYATDPSTQNGAFLVDDRGDILAVGANHFPRGVRERPERWVRPEKYNWVEHAERNAIFDAARHGVRTQGLIMICPWFACADCGRAIIQSGIKHVIGHDLDGLGTTGFAATNPTWDASIAIALKMLEEAGVTYEYVRGRVDPADEIRIRRNGGVIGV